MLGIGASSSAAYTLRKHYTKNLLPFECKFDRGGIDPAPIIAQVEAGSKKKSNKTTSVPSPGRSQTAIRSGNAYSLVPSVVSSSLLKDHPTRKTRSQRREAVAPRWMVTVPIRAVPLPVVILPARIRIILSSPRSNRDLVSSRQPVHHNNRRHSRIYSDLHRSRAEPNLLIQVRLCAVNHISSHVVPRLHTYIRFDHELVTFTSSS